ncbi:MAG: alanine:cation symporter family protein [Lentisphaerae bacterium]|nr:alanine:cation symporter family protein [Lentisphaerota bacterium]
MLKEIYDFLMYLTGWPLAAVLISGGTFFTFRTAFVQLRLLVESFRVVLEKPAQQGSVSSFGALMISTASRVGTGNIVGVSSAICIGGPGAVFWMWLTALIGGAAAFAESTLAQIFKRRNPDGSSYGGPSFYIESVFKNKFLAVLFALALIFTYGVGYNMLASYNLQSSFSVFKFYRPWFCWLCGGVTAALFLATILGGSKRLVKTTGILVPLMGICYVLFALAALVINAKHLPVMFETIFASAFDFKAIFGGFAGSVFMLGLKRGLYSNEAGIGSAPNAAAAANVSHPVKQGLVQMLSVFIDTHLICTATALMCLSSSVVPSAKNAGAPYVQAALAETFGMAGPIFILAAMVLFSFTTLLGNFYYVENCFAYIFRRTPGKKTLLVIRIAGALLIFGGAGLQMDIAWGIADISQCILAFINIPVCLLCSGIVAKTLADYTAQRKAGGNPVFNAARAGITQKTEFWN